MGCGEASDVVRIASGNHRSLELERRRHDEGVHGVPGRQTRFAQECASGLGNRTREVTHGDAVTGQQVIDCGIEPRPPTDLGKNSSRHTNESPSLEGNPQDCASSFGENATFGSTCQRMHRFRV
jgi:hypothetical protein